jgi:hypothetical protein
MAYIAFTDGGGAVVLDNGLRGSAVTIAGSRFADWVPFQRPIGAAAVALGTGARSMFTFRTDYGATFALNDIPNTKMSDMLRCQAWLLGGGLVAVYTEDSGTPERTYATCCLAPNGDVGITLQDKNVLTYSMSFALINVAASPSAMLCIYD